MGAHINHLVGAVPSVLKPLQVRLTQKQKAVGFLRISGGSWLLEELTGSHVCLIGECDAFGSQVLYDARRALRLGQRVALSAAGVLETEVAPLPAWQMFILCYILIKCLI